MEKSTIESQTIPLKLQTNKQTNKQTKQNKTKQNKQTNKQTNKQKGVTVVLDQWLVLHSRDEAHTQEMKLATYV